MDKEVELNFPIYYDFSSTVYFRQYFFSSSLKCKKEVFAYRDDYMNPDPHGNEIQKRARVVKECFGIEFDSNSSYMKCYIHSFDMRLYGYFKEELPAICFGWIFRDYVEEMKITFPCPAIDMEELKKLIDEFNIHVEISSGILSRSSRFYRLALNGNAFSISSLQRGSHLLKDFNLIKKHIIRDIFRNGSYTLGLKLGCKEMLKTEAERFEKRLKSCYALLEEYEANGKNHCRSLFAQKR